MDKTELIITDSYFDIFRCLQNRLNNKVAGIGKENNLIFCEEKISLMAERTVAEISGGSFNTKVYSFGKYLKSKKTQEKMLSKEGSAMAVKKILSETNLSCFSESRVSLAPSVSDLIMLFKSSKVSVADVENAVKVKDGLLKNKLSDVKVLYEKYEEFLKSSSYEDQSSYLSYLPKIIEEDEEIKNSNVILLGFTSWTRQARDVVLSLLKNAKSVCAILTSGNNKEIFLSETVDVFKLICDKEKIKYSVKEEKSDYNEESKIILDNLFLINGEKPKKADTDKIFYFSALNQRSEIERVAETIKETVLKKGARYKDFTVAVPDDISYRQTIQSVFNELEIPFFYDVKAKITTHPIVRLIVGFYNLKRKNLSRDNVIEIIKNPLVFSDKAFTDELVEYLIRFNINYKKFETPFTFGDKDKFEDARKRIMEIYRTNNVFDLFTLLNVEDKLKESAQKLEDFKCERESAVEKQVYSSVMDLLNEEFTILKDVSLTYQEKRDVFVSGINALEISIIPQYNDAVFIGGYKETAIRKAEYLFTVGLNSSVPTVSEDVALLSDGEIKQLSDIEMIIEPRIRVINKRAKENFALSLTAFNKCLVLSFAEYNVAGEKQTESEAIADIKDIFNLKTLSFNNKYLTKRQGIRTFTKNVGRLVVGKSAYETELGAFYSLYGEEIDKILAFSRQEFSLYKKTGDGLLRGNVSPTLIENFYKCPYYAFCNNILGVKETEKSDVDFFSIGNVVHKIFEQFIYKGYIEKGDVLDGEEKADNLISEIIIEVLKDEKYSRFIADAREGETIQKAVSDAKLFCKKFYFGLKKSKFKPKYTEYKFGEDGDSNLKILDGRIGIKGRIDRIDEYGDYVKIIDYKTGGISGSVKDLFDGTKIQLFLYGKVFEGKKDVAGVYYQKVEDAYKGESEKDKLIAGRTLDDDNVITALDEDFNINQKSQLINASIVKGKKYNFLSADKMSAMIEYAYKICEQGASDLDGGFITPSPIKGQCDNCPYLALCRDNVSEREIGKVTDDTINDAIRGNGNGN
ncbi:MAG: PD-(D/E)XK nuclease family protein [Clostridia bacterium]|nr:PD-(D/E)XK nuclease family protein [Clostridia bacterium]